MKNKYLVELVVPFMSGIYNVYIPINERVDVVINLILKGLKELIDQDILNDTSKFIIIDASTGKTIDNNSVIRSTGIKNGSKLVLTLV